MIYAYRVKKHQLADVEKSCLRGEDEIISVLSPRELQKLYCAPNGDTFPLRPSAVHLTSAIALQ